jgi:RHS repeat-associated protein
MSDAVGASTFTYKNFGAFMGALASEDGPWPSDTITNTYGSNYKLAIQTLTQPSGNWTKYLTYDPIMRLRTIASPAGTFTYNYYGTGREIQSLSLPGGNTIAETYDDAGQLLTTALQHGSTALDSYGYAYDAGGNRTSVQRAGGASVSYGYDNIGQLTSAVGVEPDGTTVRGNENFSYGYDPAGNLATRNNNTLAQTFTTDNANQLQNISRNSSLTVAGSLTSQPNNLAINGQPATLYNDLTFAAANGVAINDGLNIFTAIVTTASSTMTNSMTKTLPASVNFTYDLNGNLTSDGLHGYDYDCANELTRETVTNSWKTEYAYDGFGRRRIRKEYVWQNSQWLTANEVHYIYDGMTVLQERNAINVPMVTYTQGNDLSGTREGAGGIGGLLARTDANGSAYYHTDGNGNVMAMVNGSGSLVAKYLYDSFGNLIAKSGSLADANTYRFSSKELDVRSGLYYYGFRFYDPNLQRWPNPDPLGEKGGINLYRFNYNSPLYYIDPDGLTPRGTAWGAAAGFGIGAALGGTIGGAGGTLALPGGGTLAGAAGVGAAGAAWGAALGGAAGNAISDLWGRLNHPPCNQMAKGNGSGGGHEYGGGNKNIDQIADKYGMDSEMRREFGQYVEDAKMMEGRGGADHLSWQQLDELAQEFLGL